MDCFASLAMTVKSSYAGPPAYPDYRELGDIVRG